MYDLLKAAEGITSCAVIRIRLVPALEPYIPKGKPWVELVPTADAQSPLVWEAGSVLCSHRESLPEQPLEKHSNLYRNTGGLEYCWSGCKVTQQGNQLQLGRLWWWGEQVAICCLLGNFWVTREFLGSTWPLLKSTAHPYRGSARDWEADGMW